MIRQSNGTKQHFESLDCCAEFVGCSPSLSGALRVNPWSVDSIADGIYSAIKMPKADQRLRHEKHWNYVNKHTVSYWAGNCVEGLIKATIGHAHMKTYGLGLGLDTFRCVAFQTLSSQKYSSNGCRYDRIVMVAVIFLLNDSRCKYGSPIIAITLNRRCTTA